MNSESKQPETGSTDHQEIQQTLGLLDRTTSWFLWNTVVMTFLLLVALLALADPQVAGWSVIPQQLDVTVVVGGILMMMLILNAYSLYRQHNFQQFRVRLAGQMQDTVQQRMRADKFYGLAILDPLTGLYNRRFGEESLQREIDRAEKFSLDMAVIAIDLDYFKEINDEFGHAAGDLVLKEFARVLRRAIRACDVPIRLGGDEFLIVLPECPKENLPIILSRLKPFEVMVNRRKIMVSYSRGNAQYQVSDTCQTIVQRADMVLYAEKAARSATAV